ncbi:MAG: FHA domain-containing protein [Acidimicrobiia bacterium]|nr:FHA domain-containing protein [Acidimicrobiia bacterium]
MAGLVRTLERRLERFVEGLSAALFRSGVGPVELGDRLVREADLLVSEGPTGPAIPNVWVVRAPLDVPADYDLDPLRRELAYVVNETARARGWRLEGPTRVTVLADESVPRGTIRADTSFEPGELPPWAELVGAGGRWQLRHNREAIGRSMEADIVISNPEVSRRHVLIWREGEDVLIADLDSANGTTLNGADVEHPETVVAGDLIGLGLVTVSYRPL